MFQLPGFQETACESLYTFSNALKVKNVSNMASSNCVGVRGQM